jgi:hypothetical protein
LPEDELGSFRLLPGTPLEGLLHILRRKASAPSSAETSEYDRFEPIVKRMVEEVDEESGEETRAVVVEPLPPFRPRYLRSQLDEDETERRRSEAKRQRQKQKRSKRRGEKQKRDEQRRGQQKQKQQQQKQQKQSQIRNMRRSRKRYMEIWR